MYGWVCGCSFLAWGSHCRRWLHKGKISFLAHHFISHVLSSFIDLYPTYSQRDHFLWLPQCVILSCILNFENIGLNKPKCMLAPHTKDSGETFDTDCGQCAFLWLNRVFNSRSGMKYSNCDQLQQQIPHILPLNGELKTPQLLLF